MASRVMELNLEVGDRRLPRPQGFVEEVAKIIRADIMSLRIPPDARISIDRLARELGVSQTPIREALSTLEARGLVVRRHYAGYCSTPLLNRQQFDELYEVRLLLEPLAARRAAQRITGEVTATLRGLCAMMRACEGPRASDRLEQIDAELHDAIAEASGSLIIRQTLSRLDTHFHIFRLCARDQILSKPDHEHEKLVDALTSGDPIGAERAMRRHVQKSHDQMRPLVVT